MTVLLREANMCALQLRRLLRLAVVILLLPVLRIAPVSAQPVEFKVSSITDRGVVVVFADGTQTLLE